MEHIIIDEVEMNEINNRNQRSSRARSCSSGRERARGLSPEAHVAHLRFLELRRAELIQTYSSNNNILNFADTPGTSTTTMDELTPMWSSIAELTESYNNNDGYIPNFMQMEHNNATPTHYPSSMVEEIVPWQLPVAPLEPLPPVAEELPENFHDYDYLEAPPTPPTLLELNVLQQQQQQQQQQIIIDDNVVDMELIQEYFPDFNAEPPKKKKMIDPSAKYTSDVCIGCLCTHEEVNIIYGPCGCACVNYCADCMNDGIEEKLANMHDWKRAVDRDQILGESPHCACCNKEYRRLVRRSRRTKRSNSRFFDS
uniref:RING-type domain-containing protein n=1 Tax=Meloidogyne incognita TaxID=6306 RepID=A0A914LSY6_MELIC